MKTSDSKPEATQRSVNCPRWLQKKMLKNLARAAKSKVNPVRAKKAAEALATANQEDCRREAAPKAPRTEEARHIDAERRGGGMHRLDAARLTQVAAPPASQHTTLPVSKPSQKCSSVAPPPPGKPDIPSEARAPVLAT